MGAAGRRDAPITVRRSTRRFAVRRLPLPANMIAVQTRYLILASLVTGVAILVASALWLARF